MTYTIITGASSGIGKELAFTYAINGCNLILVARRIDILEDVKKELQSKYGVSVTCVACDLSSLQETVQVFKQLNESHRIDCLINNAGIAFFNPIQNIQVDELRVETNLNINSPIITTKLCLDNLKQHHGSVINICSILSYMPNANASVYVATKHAILGFSNSLRIEEPDLHVLTVHPKTVKTNFFKDDTYFKKRKFLDAEDVSKLIYKAHQKRKRTLNLPKVIPVLRLFYVLIPRCIDFLNKRFYSKK